MLLSASATPPPSPPKAETPPAGASTHIPIDLDDKSHVIEVKRTSKRSRQHEVYSAEPGGNTVLIDDNIVKRQKVNRQECVTETPGLVDYQDVKSILHTKEPVKATNMEVTEPPEQSTRGRKRASMTIDKFFSQHEGSRAKKLQFTPEVSDTKNEKGMASQGNEPPYVESHLGQRRRKDAERIAEDLFHNEKLKSAIASKFRARAKK